MKKIDLPVLLLAVAAFLCPLIGGYISLDSLSSTEGLTAAPILVHTFIGFFAVMAFALVTRRKVVQVPNSTLATVLAIFFGILGASALLSPFRLASLGAVAEWMFYGVAFFATVASAGRKTGPTAILTAIFSGSVIVAMRGLMEYGVQKAQDPTWRIFAGWVNPNATAAMLLVGFFAGLGILSLTQERLFRLISGLGVTLIGLTIFLTGSKGGFLAGAVAFIVFVILIAPMKAEKALPRVFTAVGATVVLIGAVLASANAASGKAAAAGAAARLATAGQTTDQSAGFRTLLWKGAIELMKDRPIGYGPGTYRYESARSGLTTQTTLAHQSFLQLGVEGSPILPILLIVAGVLWTRLVFRGWRRLPESRKLLQASVFCAVVALTAHCLVDSDLHYFGTGLCFFILLGLGTLLSADGVVPEFSPSGMRQTAAAFALGTTLLGLFAGWAEFKRAEIRSCLAAKDYSGAVANVDSLLGMVPFDGDGWYFRAQLAPAPVEQIEFAKKATEYLPTPRNYRFLGRLLASQEKYPEALTALRTVFQRDPNNLLALAQIAQVEAKSGNLEGAKKANEQLVQVETTPYFQVRSIPELVPTETYMARLALAESLTGKSKIEMLAPAVAGFEQYLLKTVPIIKAMAPLDYSGETVEGGQQKLITAAVAANELADLYRMVGDTERSKAASELATRFTGAFDK